MDTLWYVRIDVLFFIIPFYQYDFIKLFACSFTLGPLIMFLIHILDLRIDGLRLLWLFRRPVAHRAQDIGAWFYIIRILNVVGIVSNAFIIAFTSNWSNNVLQGKLENRLLFIVVFEVNELIAKLLKIPFTHNINIHLK